VSWRLSETWLSGRRVVSLRCDRKLKHKPSTHRRTTMKIMVGIDLHSNNALCGRAYALNVFETVSGSR
jgi:hypothetical protein